MKLAPPLAAILLMSLGLAPVAGAVEATRPDLIGQVAGEAGIPVAGVTVMILAAGPRVGNSALCPYNYPDCGKKTLSDGQGQFRLVSLDPSLDFCIITLAPGYEPFVNSKVLPEAGPVSVKLRKRDLTNVPAARHVFGRIIGPDGAAVAGATIDVEGVERPDAVQWGGNNATDSMTISDANGEFHLIGHKDFVAVQAIIEAPGLAKRWARLEPGKALFLRMTTGSTIRGRLTMNDQPFRNVTLGLATEERECGKYFRDYRVTTNDDGSFVVQNVPAGLKFQIYGLMDSLRSCDAAFQATFTSPREGGSLDLGNVAATRAYHLRGRIVLADGKPLPPKTRLMIDRLSAWDMTLVPVSADGNFALSGIPGESIHCYLQLPGYRLSDKNPNLDLWNRMDLVGRVSGDVAAFNILLEPGKPPDWNEVEHVDSRKAEQSPLRGVPAGTF